MTANASDMQTLIRANSGSQWKNRLTTNASEMQALIRAHPGSEFVVANGKN